MRIRLLISYIGTRYHGWQIQAKTSDTITIQGVLEKALSSLFQETIRVVGAGRTDAGVHAIGQVAHADVPKRSDFDIRKGLNALLPKDISVLECKEVCDSFHARFDATQKTYAYHFWTERGFVPPQRFPYVWSCGELNCNRICAAIPFILGSHDFASVQNTGADTKTSVRTVLCAKLSVLPQSPYLPQHAPECVLTITANGFLKQMVRNLAGIFVAVGQNKLEPHDVENILAEKERKKKSLPHCSCARINTPMCRVYLKLFANKSGSLHVKGQQYSLRI